MPMLSPRRQVLLALAGGGAAAIIALALGIAGAIAGADAFSYAVLAGLGALVLTAVIGTRRVDGKVQRLIWAHREHAEAAPAAVPHQPLREIHPALDAIVASLGEDRVEAMTRTSILEEQVADIDRRLTAALDDLSRDMSRRLDGIASDASGAIPMMRALKDEVATVQPRLRELSKAARQLSRAGELTYEQLESFVDLRTLLQPAAPMPALRGWSASPDVLRLLIETVLHRRPETIVECGSGSSTVWLGYALRLARTGRIVSLEHDPRFAAISRDLIRAHGLEDVVEIRSAPLEDWTDGDHNYPWYAEKTVNDLDGIGVLFVDGPPGATAPQVRYPAVPRMLPRCASDAVIVLDDAGRPDERALSDRWLAGYPELERVVHQFEKGAHVFTRRPS